MSEYKSEIKSCSKLFDPPMEKRLFYVPEYQRAFTWKVDEKDLGQIHRLLEDIAARISETAEKDDDKNIEVTFLGSIILTSNKSDSLKGNFKDSAQRPTYVWHVIDGQQRMTSLLLILAAIYQLISDDRTVLTERLSTESVIRDHRDIDKAILPSASKEIKEISKETMGRINKILKFGDNAPRIFRLNDKIASQIKEGEFKSRIADFLTKFFQMVDEKKPGFSLGQEPELVETYHDIKKLLKRDFLKEEDLEIDENDEGINQIEFLNNKEILKSRPLLGLIGISEEKDESNWVDDLLNSRENAGAQIKRLAIVCIIAEYILNYVQMAEVNTATEEEAIEVFEAMNTTGDPLTSIETFKPRVISDLGSDYKDKDGDKCFQQIQAHLDTYSRDEEAKAIAKIVNTFNYCLNGRRMGDPKSFRHQRRSLRRTYEKIDSTDIEKKLKYLNLLTRVSNIYETEKDWKEKDKKLSKDTGESPETKVSSLQKLDLNKDAALSLRVCSQNFPISMAIPALLLDAWNSEDNADFKKTDFTKGMKALLGFWGLYRGQFGGTNGIDQQIRKLLKENLSFWMDEDNKIRKQDVDELCDHLQQILVDVSPNKKLDKTQWVKGAKNIPIYEKNKDVARLLLLASHHNKKASRVQGKLEDVSSGRKSLTLEAWCLPNQYTVEHIAPQNPSNGTWADDLYEANGTIHRLGNLILLPKEINSSLSNKSWKTKQAAYKYINAETKEEKNPPSRVLRKELGNDGLRKFVQLVEHLEDDSNKRDLGGTQVWKLCAKPVAKITTFNLKKINTRSQDLSGHAYDKLKKWLG